MAVVGYVPEYRFSTLNWQSVVERTTHLVLFSVEPTASGTLDGLDRMWPLTTPDSELHQALRRAGEAAPKVLLCIGGAGRSQHFAEVGANGKLRKKLVRSISQLLEEHPVLAGVDIDWEQPQEPEHWRALANIAHQLRSAWSKDSKDYLLSATFHPKTAAVSTFKSMESTKTGRSFAEMFDMLHTMAYTYYDSERRHSTLDQAAAAIGEWEAAGLPLDRLTLGVPFFGVSRRLAKTLSYGEILDMDRSLIRSTQVDETAEGTYFNNKVTMTKKLELASRKGLAGIMIWELGQDKPAQDASSGSMLRHIWETVQHLRSPTLLGTILRFAALKEEHIVMTLAMTMGFILLFRVVSSKPPHMKVSSRPVFDIRDAPNGQSNDGDVTEPPAEEHQDATAEQEDS